MAGEPTGPWIPGWRSRFAPTKRTRSAGRRGRLDQALGHVGRVGAVVDVVARPGELRRDGVGAGHGRVHQHLVGPVDGTAGDLADDRTLAEARLPRDHVGGLVERDRGRRRHRGDRRRVAVEVLVGDVERDHHLGGELHPHVRVLGGLLQVLRELVHGLHVSPSEGVPASESRIRKFLPTKEGALLPEGCIGIRTKALYLSTRRHTDTKLL